METILSGLVYKFSNPPAGHDCKYFEHVNTSEAHEATVLYIFRLDAVTTDNALILRKT